MHYQSQVHGQVPFWFLTVLYEFHGGSGRKYRIMARHGLSHKFPAIQCSVLGQHTDIIAAQLLSNVQYACNGIALLYMEVQVVLGHLCGQYPALSAAQVGRYISSLQWDMAVRHLDHVSWQICTCWIQSQALYLGFMEAIAGRIRLHGKKLHINSHGMVSTELIMHLHTYVKLFRMCCDA